MYLPAPALYGPFDSLTDRSGAQAPGPRGSVATGINGHSTFTYRARAWRDRQRRRLWRQPVLRRPLVCPDLSSHFVICLLRGTLKGKGGGAAMNISKRRSTAMTVLVADGPRNFHQCKVRKKIYGTGWDEMVKVRALLDGGLRG